MQIIVLKVRSICSEILKNS